MARVRNTPTALRPLLLCLAAGILGACGNSDPLQSESEWIFVNYWAEWCKPCIREIPELNGLDRREGYRVLGVNFDGATGAELEEQVEALGVEFPTLEKDPGPRFSLETPEVLPTTLVLAPGGTLHRVLVGPQTAESLVAATRAPPA